jgi:hypothetical protein
MPTNHSASKTSLLQRWGSSEVLNLIQAFAILLAGCWAVYTFIYQQQIQPALEPPALTVDCRLEKVGTQGNITAIKATITRKNVGQQGIRILGLAHNLRAVKQNLKSATVPDTPIEPLHTDIASFLSNRYIGPPLRDEVVARGASLFHGGTDLEASVSELNAGESLSRDLLFFVDHQEFDSVRIKIQLIYQKMDDAPVVLRLSSDAHDEIVMTPKTPCTFDCNAISETDFTTDLSLW